MNTDESNLSDFLLAEMPGHFELDSQPAHLAVSCCGGEIEEDFKLNKRRLLAEDFPQIVARHYRQQGFQTEIRACTVWVKKDGRVIKQVIMTLPPADEASGLILVTVQAVN